MCYESVSTWVLEYRNNTYVLSYFAYWIEKLTFSGLSNIGVHLGPT